MKLTALTSIFLDGTLLKKGTVFTTTATTGERLIRSGSARPAEQPTKQAAPRNQVPAVKEPDEPTPQEQRPAPPRKTAPKKAWEDYATALGIPAAGLTKPELIAVCLDY
ncbi:hypothetical protein [Corynebacterium sp. 045007]|uniref:hypothetical protein n=1 Tax=Corynebacterium sp. 045007 TaxID=3156078 RepID=UPI00345B4F58